MLKLQLKRSLCKKMSLITQTKKLVSVLVAFLSMTRVSIEIQNGQLEHVLFIKYLMKFKKVYTKVQALLNLDNKVNTMTLIYAIKLELCIYSTSIGAQKIDGFTFSTYNMILTIFQLKDKQKKMRFS